MVVRGGGRRRCFSDGSPSGCALSTATPRLPARHAVARSAKAGRWADDAVARVVELVREDSLQALDDTRM